MEMSWFGGVSNLGSATPCWSAPTSSLVQGAPGSAPTIIQGWVACRHGSTENLTPFWTFMRHKVWLKMKKLPTGSWISKHPRWFFPCCFLYFSNLDPQKNLLGYRQTVGSSIIQDQHRMQHVPGDLARNVVTGDPNGTLSKFQCKYP